MFKMNQFDDAVTANELGHGPSSFLNFENPNYQTTGTAKRRTYQRGLPAQPSCHADGIKLDGVRCWMSKESETARM
jgi:hypothetical protein